MDEVNFVTCSFPVGLNRHAGNPSIAKGCGHIAKLCENMKKCYLRFRKYFTFSSLFKRYMMRMGIVCVGLMIAAFLVNLMEWLGYMKLKRFMIEKISECCLIILLLLCGIILIIYPFAARDLHWREFGETWVIIYEYFTLSGLRWAWEILLYFLLLSFYVHMISYATRTYFTLSIVTNVCKYAISLLIRKLLLWSLDVLRKKKRQE